MLSRVKRNVAMDVQDNKVQYLLVVFFLTVGITAGTFTISNLHLTAKTELSEYIKVLLIGIKTQPIDYFAIFLFAWLHNTVLFAIMAAFSLLMIGIPLTTAVVIYKGFCVGFTLGVLSLIFGSGGFVMIIIAVFLTNLVLIPCICKACISGWNQSISVIKERRIPKTTRDRLYDARPFFRKLIKIYFFSLIGVLIETFISPAFMKII